MKLIIFIRLSFYKLNYKHWKWQMRANSCYFIYGVYLPHLQVCKIKATGFATANRSCFVARRGSNKSPILSVEAKYLFIKITENPNFCVFN